MRIHKGKLIDLWDAGSGYGFGDGYGYGDGSYGFGYGYGSGYGPYGAGYGYGNEKDNGLDEIKTKGENE